MLLQNSHVVAQQNQATANIPNEEIKFTADMYPHLKRNPNFKNLSQDDISYFQSILPSNALTIENDSNQDDLTPYNVDWLRIHRGKSKLVAKPKTTAQVSNIVKYCNEKKLAIVPQGGNTGLVGGGIPIFDEIIISTKNLNQIRAFDPISRAPDDWVIPSFEVGNKGTLICDSGCILEILDDYLAERGHMMPLDIGSKGSCHIGGNVATNAGGVRYVRYGSLHGSVLGLEVVLPDGTILDNLSTLRKDNTGYDIKQLFIGSEGTLGIITGVSISASRRHKTINLAVLGLNSFKSIQDAFITSKEMLTEILSAFEFWDAQSLKLVKTHLNQGAKFPLDEYPFYVLIETGGSNKDHDEEKLANFLETVMEKGIVENGIIAQDNTQMKSLWSIREGIPDACAKAGSAYFYDISIPIPVMYKIVEDVISRLKNAGLYGKPVMDVIGFGHVGDGNLHLAITAESYSPKIINLIESCIGEWTEKYKGSLSAEHGLGLMKAKILKNSKPKAMVDIMRQMKHILDPNGIMNPYKFFPYK
ncbi:1603_t:CDS:10 [Dentiscutata erythropus]|uniref:D-lactate dehydrogenase (cytochrome) n=1 Tax=Dentiscutata erythropus TaxID=1348616 RepID=A0A9N9AYP5_9GLOM|nr:1603_t:CDS:10 [Dentiscutata erythropus]